MQRVRGRAIAMYLAGAALGSTALMAQARGDWPMTGGDPGQSGSQKAETKLSPVTVPSSFRFLWKIQLGKTAEAGTGFTEPLLISRLINAQGFKDIVFWSSSNSLYAVDSELGILLWTKTFDASRHAASACSAGLGVALDQPVVINFNARRTPGARRSAPQGPMAVNERRLGVSPGGGGFGLKGIYVLTGDGMLHEQVVTTGADFAPPVKFLPAANGGAYGLNIEGKTLFTATGRDCRGVANGLWAIDVSSPDYPVAEYATGKVKPLALTAPVVAPDGTTFAVTGSGASDAGAGVYANSVVALGKDMKVRDWYTPASGLGSIQSVSPVTFTHKDKQYVVAPGKDGSFVLLDPTSLGGTDHHTPLSETAGFAAAGSRHGWDGFAKWTDKEGSTWIFASISAPIVTKEKSATSHGPTMHGGVVAFRIDDADQKPILTPIWISGDMVNPAPPVVANGIVAALSGGSASTHAVLTVLDATTGKSLYDSKDEVPTYTRLAGLALGDGHIFFADHNGMLYSFGIAIEH